MYPVRIATLDDRPAIDSFADDVVHDAYDALVSVDYAQMLLDHWWGDALDDDIRSGRILVATDDDAIVGMTQVGEYNTDPVMWKLYVAGTHRSRGIGARLTTELIRTLPGDAERLVTEHIASNERAGAFYEREGFEVIGEEPHEDPRLSVVWRARQLEKARRSGRLSLAWW